MSNNQNLKILFASQVAFWRNQTGAEQRILSLVKFLVSRGHRVETIFCGKLDDNDRAEISRHELIVDAVFQEPEPETVLERVAWESRCTVNWLAKKLRFVDDDELEPESGRPLAGFRSRAFAKSFSIKLKTFRPDLVIVEYISLAYLAEEFPVDLRRKTVLAIDTHDVMHSRYKQFLQAGENHWIHVTEDQEREALKAFDLIIAIQPAEADEFRRILPGSRVIEVLHSPPMPPTIRPCNVDRPTFGYLGSSNASNVSAINLFLDEIWPRVVEQTKGEAQLVIGGRVSETLRERSIPNGRPIGFVEEPASFYEQVHAVVNPVNFGTGLKIKNLEALCFGKILITSTAGINGLPRVGEPAFFVADSVDRFVEILVELTNDRNLRKSVSARAVAYAQEFFHRDRVYPPLLDAVHSIRESQASTIP